jgi:hypothetical protein
MGKGLVAQQPIKAGTRILVEKPLFVAPASFYFKPSTSAAERLVKQHIESHNATDQAAWELLSNYHPFAEYREDGVGTGDFIKTHYIGKFKTAGIPIPLGARRRKAHHFGVFPLLSWANHACHPNANHAWNESLKAITVCALDDIASGEQITISYAPANVIDRDLINKTYGFTCYCDWCTQRPEDRQQSDANYRKVEAWSMRIHREEDEGKAMWIANCALMAMLEEGIKDYRLGLLFADAFDIAVNKSDDERARILGLLACKAYMHCEGPESDAAIRVRKALGELMRRVEKGEGDNGKGQAVNGKGSEDVLPPGLENWVKRGQEGFDEKRQVMSEKAFEWLFMSELWPKQMAD